MSAPSGDPPIMAMDYCPVLRPGEVYTIPGFPDRPLPLKPKMTRDAFAASTSEQKARTPMPDDFDLDGANATQIITALIGMVPPEKAELAGKMLKKLVGSDAPDPEVAADAALRQRAAQARLQGQRRAEPAYLERFPNANRLG